MTSGAAPAGAPPRRSAPSGPVAPFHPELVERTIPEVFEARAAPHRSRLALRMGARALSYAQLDAAAERVAAALVAAVPPGPGRVVLLLDDRVRQVLSILGVLKAGLAFVPLDPGQPAPRLEACVTSARACALLAEPGTHALASAIAGGLPILDASALERAAARGAGPARPVHAAGPYDPACILYTSGSTGRPKGVVQTHRNVLHNVAKLTTSLRFAPDDRVTLLGHVAFAASMSDLFPALLNGASLHPYDVRRQGVEGLAGWMAAEGITVFASVPTLFRHALAGLEDDVALPSLRLLKLAGEPVQRRDVELFRRRLRPPTLFLNSLGSTEINTIRQHFLDHTTPLDTLLDGPLVPVGHAVEGTDVLVLDAEGRPLPAGETGELAVRSDFLSPGYWDAPEETARAFGPDPEGSSRRIFRTGDLGRLRPDGCLEHLGRKDGQVRVRGHRVETAEVEAALLARGDIAAAAVVGRPGAGGDVELVAWLVARSARPPAAADLRAGLAAALPDYMLPARYLFRATLPLLSTGKVDRLALAELPAPEGGAARPAAASDPLQQRLIAMWERVLRIQGIGPDDDFFDLGGHSLLAARIVARIQHQLGVALPLSIFREAPTVAGLAAHIARGGAQRPGPLVVLQEGALPAFYCVPSAGSDAFSLLQLARALGPEQPLVALQIPGLHPGERPPETVEEIAALFLGPLRARQPHGPYALGGSSFGGVVAFALAQALRAAGEEVALLALFDVLAPGHPRLRRGLGPRHWPRLAARWVLPRGSKEHTGRRALRRGLREKLERARFHLRRALRPDAPPPQSWRFAWLREHCFRAQDCYHPAQYPGPVLLFRHEHQAPAELYESGDDLGWGELVGGELGVRALPGLHGDALRPPAVNVVARALGDALPTGT